MFAQLGNIVFSGLYGFNQFGFEGDEAVYGEHEIIGGKGRLEKTGDTLQDITLGVKMHASFCNPKQQISQINEYKRSGEVLSLLLGDSSYIGDFVIQKFSYEVKESFSDGAIICIEGQISLKEFIAYNKSERDKQQARLNAFAVGDKQAVVNRPPQPETELKNIARDVSMAKMQGSQVDSLVSDYENNASSRQVTGSSILSSCESAIKSMSNMQDKLNQAQEAQNKYTGLKAAASSVSDAFNGIKDRMPPQNISDLRTANTYLQSVLRTFSRVSTPLMKDVILRKDG